jgi:hypothetical protein
MDKKKWQDAVMDSLNNMERAEPDPGLFDRITRRIDQVPTSRARVIPMQSIRLAAACFAGLLILNIWILAGRQGHDSQDSGKGSGSESTAWQIKRANYQIYDL